MEFDTSSRWRYYYSNLWAIRFKDCCSAFGVPLKTGGGGRGQGRVFSNKKRQETQTGCKPPRVFIADRYSWELMANIVFEGQNYAGFDTCLVCYGKTGTEVSVNF